MTNGGSVDGNASVRTPRAGAARVHRVRSRRRWGGGWAATCCGLGGRAGGRTRRSASLPFVLAGPDLSGTLQGVDGAAGANHISAFGANGNVRLDADCMANVDKWPRTNRNGNRIWEHSDFKNVAYFFVYKLFDRLVGKKSN